MEAKKDIQEALGCSKKGLRAQRLHDLLEKSLSQTIKACSYKQIAKCFPTLAKNSPDVLKNVHEQVISFLQSSCEREFSSILKERDVVPRLNELDNLIVNAKSRQERGDPSTILPTLLSPEHIVSSHLYPLKMKELSVLKNQLENVIFNIQTKNMDFCKKVASQRDEIAQLTMSIKKTIEELDLAVQCSIQAPIQSMQAQMDEIDQEFHVQSEISSLSSQDLFLQKIEELLFLNASGMERQRFKLSEKKLNEMYELSFKARLERAEKRRFVNQDANKMQKIQQQSDK
ncbi:hypothetical protein PCK2_000365 [Pneumocystis canis]|nr:hypothetical protein PCK2_000365 [Pneumocystis canis]